ncbi:ABC transporter permease [Bacillus amyloliquefaciens]|uniref:ABC transporter permease n=1 Tax=Bacillus amyloliquefaciens TaxID=1390 RepID=UPI0022AF777E|nr:ABC transporter permease [Bacillus amyloliquefaciens]MCZ4246732.1 ABC transporter permease [Bacillus amyloliquefaciens]
MTQLLFMIRHQLKLMLQNRAAIFATISVPLLLTYFFSFSADDSQQRAVYVADADQSVFSGQFMKMIQTAGHVKVTKVTEDVLKTKINHQDISFGLLIGSHFEETLFSGDEFNVSFIQNEEKGDAVLTEQLIAQQAGTLKKIVRDAKVMSRSLHSDGKQSAADLLKDIQGRSAVTVDRHHVYADGQAAGRLIGFLVMFIWFVAVQSLRSFIDEQENHTYARLLSTPVSYTAYAISKFAAAYLFGLLHIIVILAAGKFMLHIRFADHVLAAGAVLAACSFALTSVTMAVIPFMKSQKQFTSLASVFIAVTGLLGGAFFTLDSAPEYMRTLSLFTPEKWAIGAFQNNEGSSTQIAPLSLFLAAGAVSLALSLYLISRNMKKHG